jgi:hypothetical protein
MTALGQPEKICHRDNIAGLPLTAENGYGRQGRVARVVEI